MNPVEGKLGRKRKGTFAKVAQTYENGKKRKMVAKYDGRCSICTVGFSAGLEVIYDASEEPGKKTAHVSCYLRAVDSKKEPRTTNSNEGNEMTDAKTEQEPLHQQD